MRSCAVRSSLRKSLINPPHPHPARHAAAGEQATKVDSEIEKLTTEKKTLQKKLRQFEAEFEEKNSRHPKVSFEMGVEVSVRCDFAGKLSMWHF